MKKYLSCFVVLLTAFHTHAQMHHEGINIFTPPYYKYEVHEKKNFSLLTAYNFGREDYAEFGFALNNIKRVRSNDRFNAFFISTEWRVRQSFVMAPKIGCWVGNGLGAGINAMYYTDFKNDGAIRLRPEVGFAFEGMKLVYGYNIPITNSTYSAISKHMVSLAVNTRLVKLSETKKERDWNPTARKKYETRTRDTGYSKYNIVLLMGAHGFTDAFGELGIGFYSDGRNERDNKMSGMAFLSSEVKISDQTIIAPKAGLYLRGSKKVSMGFGTSLLYYIGMKHSSLAVRPELGLNVGPIRLSYGYNHIITNYQYPSISRHNVSAVLMLKLGKGRIGDHRLDKDSTKDF